MAGIQNILANPYVPDLAGARHKGMQNKVLEMSIRDEETRRRLAKNLYDPGFVGGSPQGPTPTNVMAPGGPQGAPMPYQEPREPGLDMPTYEQALMQEGLVGSAQAVEDRERGEAQERFGAFEEMNRPKYEAMVKAGDQKRITAFDREMEKHPDWKTVMGDISNIKSTLTSKGVLKSFTRPAKAGELMYPDGTPVKKDGYYEVESYEGSDVTVAIKPVPEKEKKGAGKPHEPELSEANLRNKAADLTRKKVLAKYGATGLRYNTLMDEWVFPPDFDQEAFYEDYDKLNKAYLKKFKLKTVEPEGPDKEWKKYLKTKGPDV